MQRGWGGACTGGEGERTSREGGEGTEHGSCFPNRGPFARVLNHHCVCVVGGGVGGNRMQTRDRVGDHCDPFGGLILGLPLKHDVVTETNRALVYVDGVQG